MHNMHYVPELYDKKLLIITDIGSSNAVAESLSESGFIVMPAHCTQLIPKLFITNYPDLVLISLAMPLLEYLSVCNVLRGYFRGPVLLLLENPEDQIKLLGLEVGADEILVGPYTPFWLPAKIRAMLYREWKSRQV